MITISTPFVLDQNNLCNPFHRIINIDDEMRIVESV